MSNLYPKNAPRGLSEGQKHENGVTGAGAGGWSLFPYIGVGVLGPASPPSHADGLDWRVEFPSGGRPMDEATGLKAGELGELSGLVTHPYGIGLRTGGYHGVAPARISNSTISLNDC